VLSLENVFESLNTGNAFTIRGNGGNAKVLVFGV